VDQPSERLVSAASDGCYEAGRASALSGVPKSTVYWWARGGVVVPSVSPVREKLWSYADLMALRIVSWLRHPKAAGEDGLPASPMGEVRQALAALERRGLDLWEPDHAGGSPLVVDRAGRIFIRTTDEVTDLAGQRCLLDSDVLELMAPFSIGGVRGPNLVAPRDRLRIVPARVAGEPHIADTRLTTLSILALARRGMTAIRIAEMYDVPVDAVDDALDLEGQLSDAALAA
jgi:uncharacterized protein (DUF433 family)/DNA-binding transcriptional MerR regulator